MNRWRLPWQKRAAWTQTETLLGLGAPVEVRSDKWGIHHVFAKGEEDLFRVQGFVTARDRLFQMDMMRRLAAGRLAELFGDVPGMGFDPILHLRGQGLASVDYLMRVLGLNRAAQDGLSWLSPRTHKALMAYSEGVNEYILSTQKNDGLSLGYRILNAEPDFWKPTDSLLVLRILAFQTSFTWRLLLAYGAVCYRLAEKPEYLESLLPSHLDLRLGLGERDLPGGLRSLFPHASEHSVPYSPPNPKEKASLDEGEVQFESALKGTGQGSCAWVLSGSRTDTGGPILCNDPHLNLRLPAAFYQIHLCGGEYNVVGLSFPGSAGVFLGHNEHITWGASLSRLDDADIFIEELDQTSERYRHKERYLPLIRREEVIRVKGETPRYRWVRSTSRGPILSDALHGPLPSHLTYSLSWTGHEGVREAEAMLQTNRARNWQEFRTSLQYARVPALGYVYADRKGNIGGVLAGKCPLRPATHFEKRIFRPLPGADSRYDWEGELPFEEWPSVLNPEQGYLILSGQRPDPIFGPTRLQGIWEPSFRSHRIHSLLQRQFENKPGAHEMSRLQRDQYCLWSKDFIQRVLVPYKERARRIPIHNDFLEMLLQWNGHSGAESNATLFFAMFQRKLMVQGYTPHLGEDLSRRWFNIANELEPPVEALMRNPKLWMNGAMDAVISDALLHTHQELEERLGSNPRNWQWKQLHRLTLRPFFFWDGGLQANFIRSPMGTGGSHGSINTGSHSWDRLFEHRVGAVARQIINVKEWDLSTWILCGGQSEHPEAGNYDDQLELWLNGDHTTMDYSPSTVRLMEQKWLLPQSAGIAPESQLSSLSLAPYSEQQNNILSSLPEKKNEA